MINGIDFNKIDKTFNGLDSIEETGAAIEMADIGFSELRNALRYAADIASKLKELDEAVRNNLSVEDCEEVNTFVRNTYYGLQDDIEYYDIDVLVNSFGII